MITITSEQLAEADALAETAEQERLDAERVFAAGRAVMSAEKAFADATVAAAHTAARARTLRRDFDAQQVAREARAAAERDAMAGAAKTSKRLAGTRETAVLAVQAAEAAMARALAAVAVHDQAVREASAAMRVRGLDADAGQAVGGTHDGSLFLDGEAWRPVDGPSLLAHSLAGAVGAHQPRHPLARVSRSLLGGAGAEAGRRALLGEKPGA